jgi:GNAT superfamily N-acetyltransferase
MGMVSMRELRLRDESDFQLMASCIGKLYAELFGEGTVPKAEVLARLREQIDEEPAYWAFVAHDEAGELLAFVTLAESFAVFASGRYGIINELWVRGDRRSAGVGADVIDFAKAFAKRRGWQRIDVSAPADPRWDRSYAFYQRIGFVFTGRKLRYVFDAH